ncbi:uncharacterized protein BDR25DRAFT_358559 [Lindgomyces ingoldianus]|uniref:Uncharacterized protein n=1 Tax=Lindgomyces ingoldianus TaxID=673940 RepID=A0ACB6QMU8_9PLEO|nr:uncharacterized protein BDR25DRAFT_358559 [Lindgomyces ingoldianus]KAF2467435.1 hypothetical protein BDR25DRAFT_358559 [Lindgomyces ingoldianus]
MSSAARVTKGNVFLRSPGNRMKLHISTHSPCDTMIALLNSNDSLFGTPYESFGLRSVWMPGTTRYSLLVQRAYSTLKPIRMSDDKKCVDILAVFMPPRSRSQCPASPFIISHRSRTKLSEAIQYKTNLVIYSRYEISHKTDDPASRPLPNFRLLEIQWILHRDDFRDDDDNSDDIAEALRNREMANYIL